MERGAGPGAAKDGEAEPTPSKAPAKEPEMAVRDRSQGGMDLGL